MQPLTGPPYIQLQNDQVLLIEFITWVKQDKNNTLVISHLNGTETRYKYGTNAALLVDLNIIKSILYDPMNPPMFDTVNTSPPTGVYPIDRTKGCLWFGAGSTFYTWNPSSQTWVGVIIV